MLNISTHQLTLTALRSMLLLLPVLMLSACATLNEKECANGDWRSIGFEDGSRGAAAGRIGQHREACAEYAVKPDLDAYTRGRNQGLEGYCRPHNGYNAGRKGKIYQGVCPDTLESDFLIAYRTGRDIYTTEADIRKLSRTIKKQQQELEELNQLLISLEAELVSNGVGSKRRIELLAEIRGLSKEQGTMENNIKNLELDKAKLEGQVDTLLANSPY